MINVKNLRIGNIVKRVVLLPIDNSLYMPVDIVMLRDCEHYGEKWAFEGVPIEGHLLELMGFTFIEPTRSIYEKEVAPGHKVVMMRLSENEPFKFCEIHRMDNDANWAIDIDVPHSPRYIHELQNLVWAWTGNDISVDE